MDSLDEAAAETQADALRAGVRLTDDEARRMATEAADAGPDAPEWAEGGPAVDREGPRGRGRRITLNTPGGPVTYRAGGLSRGQQMALRGLDLEGARFLTHRDAELKAGGRGPWSFLHQYPDEPGRVYATTIDAEGRATAHGGSRPRA